MVSELPKGFKLRNLEVLIGKKIKIVEMDHNIDTPNGLFSKRLLARLELRSPEEIRNDPNYLKRIIDAEKDSAKHQAGWNIIKRIQASKDAKEKELAQKIEQTEDNIPEQISAFVVKEYERVIFIQNGLMELVLPGAYEIDLELQHSGSEIVWVDMTEFQFQWGFGDLFTKDFATVGLHGLVIFRISDPKKFIITITSGKKEINQHEIENYIIESVRAAFKNEISHISVESLLSQRETIEKAIHSSILNSLQNWGLELVGLHISGIKLPPEIELLQKKHLEAKIKKELPDSVAQISITQLEQNKSLELTEQNKVHLLELQKQQKELELQRLQLELEKEKQEFELKNMKLELEKTKNEVEKSTKSDEPIPIEMEKMTLPPNIEVNSITKNVAETEKTEAIITVTPEITQNSKKVEGLIREMKEKDQQLAHMDKLLMEGMISKELYEMRARLIINQLEDLRKEIATLRKA